MKAIDPIEPGAVKLAFVLTEEEIGPYPVSSEALWVLPEGPNYRIKNIPFFLDGVSFDDVVSVVRVDENQFRICSIVDSSSNSTLWISVQDTEHGFGVIDELKSLGCGVEGGVLKNYYAVNVPGALSIGKVFAVLDPAIESEWMVVDYPSIRQEED